MNRYLLLLLLLVLLGVKNAHALEFDGDVPPQIKKQFLMDMQAIQGFHGDRQSPLHQKIYGALDGRNYLRFFDSLIHSVGLNDCGGGGSVTACVIPSFQRDKMWFTWNYINFSLPQAARLMLMFHEARHADPKHDWSHSFCPTPFLDKNGKDIVGFASGMKLEGLDACDETALGAYGISTIMVKNLAKYCTTCTDKVKMDAEMLAEDQVKRITDPIARSLLEIDFQK